MEEKILEILASGEPMKTGEIADRLGVEKKEVEKAIKKLKETEQVISPKRCFYSVPR